MATESRTQLIDQGKIETKNLSECLKVDFAALYANVFPKSGKVSRAAVAEMKSLGILKRMSSVADLIQRESGNGAIEGIRSHTSDTARGWAAFMIGLQSGLTLKKRFQLIRPFADDSHFGVREWAWMAVRPHIARELDDSIALLSKWTDDSSHLVRRFASEATRPRGVWAEHIQRLKQEPELGLPILEPLMSDPERYVQDSVANWLNDAAKSQPQWVKKTCASWKKQSSSQATCYILKRALRSL